MSGDGSVTIDWPDKERKYLLRIGEVFELEAQCDRGIQELGSKFCDGTWRTQWAVHVIRLGLVGGGLDEMRAKALVGRYCVTPHIMEMGRVAQAVLLKAIVPDADDPVGKPEAERGTLQESSSARPSTEVAPSLDSSLPKSGNARSLNS